MYGLIMTVFGTINYPVMLMLPSIFRLLWKSCLIIAGYLMEFCTFWVCLNFTLWGFKWVMFLLQALNLGSQYCSQIFFFLSPILHFFYLVFVYHTYWSVKVFLRHHARATSRYIWADFSREHLREVVYASNCQCCKFLLIYFYTV